jgi:hypothetical protein
VGQRVAGRVLHVLATGPDDAAVGEHDLEAQHGVAGLAVFHAAQPAGVRPEVPADRADLVARRIRGVEQALRGDALLQLGVEDARLGDDDEVLPVDLEDPVHPRQRDREAALDAGGAAAQARAGAARHDRDPMLPGEPDEGRDLGGRRRQGHGQWQPGLEVGGLVGPVALAVGRVVEQPEVRQRGPDRGEERRAGGVRWRGRS